MDLKIRMRHGVEHSLTLAIPKEELDECLLSFPGWAEIVGSYGYIRHRVDEMPENIQPPASQDPKTGEWKKGDGGIKRYKVPPEDHLEPTVSFEGSGSVYGLNQPDEPLIDEHGQPTRRLILVGNRNLGNNPGFVAWHRAKSPRCFHLRGEPVTDREYTCLVWYESGQLTIEPIRFCAHRDNHLPYRPSDETDLSEQIVWCTFGQQVLRGGQLVDIEEIIDQFYDIRHVLWFPTHLIGKDPCPPADEELRNIYEGYPNRFKGKALAQLRGGRPRSRYFHNAVGIGVDRVVILQRHGTIEEIGQWLREEGAVDGLILDNGGSVFTWVWWAFKEVIESRGRRFVRTGNVIFSAPDWRPPTISLIAFVLKGPPRHEEPGGSVAFAVG